MGGEDGCAKLGCVLEDGGARARGGLREFAEAGIERRLIHLQWMVHHVAGKKRLLAAGYETDRRVIDAVAGSRDERDALKELVAIHCDELGKAGLDHRPHT